MMEQFSALDPVVQALLAGLFTWTLTALGAATVFLTRGIDRRVLDWMLGFAAGVMIAASFWSLLMPAIEMSAGTGLPEWVPAAVGFLAGGAFLRGVDLHLPHLHPGLSRTEGPSTSWRRSTLLVLAITIHNIPEGLAVGVAFGALAAGHDTATFAAAVALAVGIGIQNFPGGMAVSVPLRQEGLSPALLLVRAALRDRRTSRRLYRGVRRHRGGPAPPLCPRLCRGRHDLRGRRGRGA